eukprot:1187910-Prorocentrum_minimum.AAC.1
MERSVKGSSSSNTNEAATTLPAQLNLARNTLRRPATRPRPEGGYFFPMVVRRKLTQRQVMKACCLESAAPPCPPSMFS